MKTRIFALTLLLVVASCKNVKKTAAPTLKFSDTPIASWSLYNMTSSDELQRTDKQDRDELLKTAESKDFVNNGIILSIFSDGTFTRLKDTAEYKTGRWKLSGQKLYLLSSDSSIKSISFVSYASINNQQTLNLVSTNGRTQLQFVEAGRALDNFKEDPFYQSNNLWRVRPSHAETMEQLRDRLTNYLKHLIYVLKAAKERAQQIVSFEYSQGIVKIYNGGIGIVDAALVPGTWMETYYSHEDASKAYFMFRNYLLNSHYKGAGVGNWILDDYNILLSIYAGIKNEKLLNEDAKNQLPGK